MLRILVIVFSVGCLVGAAAATAGGPPVANSTERVFDQPFFDSPTFNCASGNNALADGVFSGVFHTLVKPDGSVHMNVKVRGTSQLTDTPGDDVVDATTTFAFKFTDIVFATGKEVHHATETGALTVATTGQKLRFHAVAQLVLDESGTPKLDHLRLVCA